jgi:hypothetical protein
MKSVDPSATTSATVSRAICWRRGLNVVTAAGANLDDARPSNLKALMDLAQDYLSHPDTKDALSRLCDRLTAA